MVNGERKCPNKNTTLSENLALLHPKNEEDLHKSKIHQIAALSFEELVEVKDSEALSTLGEGEREAVEWLLENYCSGLSQQS